MQMPPSPRDEEPDSKSSSRGDSRFNNNNNNNYLRQLSSRNSYSNGGDENEPLLSGPSTPTRARRHSTRTLDSAFESVNGGSQLIVHHSSDESTFFDFMMEKVRGTKVAYWADRMAVESEPGLTNAQLMLHNHDLKPGMWKRFGNYQTLLILHSRGGTSTMGPLEFCRFLGCGFVQYCKSGLFMCEDSLWENDRLTILSEHLDDFLFYDQRLWSFMVAIMALCLAWLHFRSLLRLHDWPNRCYLPHLLPCCVSILLRHLGCSLASVQQSCYGMYLVWSSGMDWRELYPSHDLIDLAILREHSEQYPRIRDEHPRFCLLPSLLAPVSSCDLVPSPQDQTSVHCQSLRRPDCRSCLLHLGCCPSQGYWTNCQATEHFSWLQIGMGNGHRYHVCHFELRYTHRGMYSPFCRTLISI